MGTPIRMGKNIRARARNGGGKTPSERNTAGWIFQTASGINGALRRAMGAGVFHLCTCFYLGVSVAMAAIGTYGLATNTREVAAGVCFPENLASHPLKLVDFNPFRKAVRKKPLFAKPENGQPVEEQYPGVP